MKLIKFSIKLGLDTLLFKRYIKILNDYKIYSLKLKILAVF